MKKNKKTWSKNILNSLKLVEQVMKRQEFKQTHTVDGKKLRKGLKVFILGDPSVQCKIIKVIKEIDGWETKRTVVLDKGGDQVAEKPQRLYISQKLAIDDSIKNIKESKAAIIRTYNESLTRLDAENRIKQLMKLKKYENKNGQYHSSKA